jgi:hypothetical protein
LGFFEVHSCIFSGTFPFWVRFDQTAITGKPLKDKKVRGKLGARAKTKKREKTNKRGKIKNKLSVFVEMN